MSILKKSSLFTFVLALIMVMAMSVTAFGAEVPVDQESAKLALCDPVLAARRHALCLPERLRPPLRGKDAVAHDLRRDRRSVPRSKREQADAGRHRETALYPADGRRNLYRRVQRLPALL